jgi:hypothetical protein
MGAGVHASKELLPDRFFPHRQLCCQRVSNAVRLVSDHCGPSAFFNRTLIQRLVELHRVLDRSNEYERDGHLHHNDGRKCREKTGQRGPPQPAAEPAVGRVQHGRQHRRHNEGGGKRPGNPHYEQEKRCQQESEKDSLSLLWHMITSNEEALTRQGSTTVAAQRQNRTPRPHGPIEERLLISA